MQLWHPWQQTHPKNKDDNNENKKKQTKVPPLSWGEAHQAKMTMVQKGEAKWKNQEKEEGQRRGALSLVSR